MQDNLTVFWFAIVLNEYVIRARVHTQKNKKPAKFQDFQIN